MNERIAETISLARLEKPAYRWGLANGKRFSHMGIPGLRSHALIRSYSPQSKPTGMSRWGYKQTVAHSVKHRKRFALIEGGEPSIADLKSRDLKQQSGTGKAPL